MSKKTAPAVPETLVYCGPAIRGIAAQYTAFSGGLPAAITAQCEKTPALRSLLVPPEKLAETRAALRDPDSVACMIYASVLESIRKGGN